MNADITQRLTHESLSVLVQQFTEEDSCDCAGMDKRKYPRKPVAGVVEFWPADGDWQEPLVGECCNISEGGLGMSCYHYLELQTLLGFAVHLDMTSYHGLAIVRYCRKVRDKFMVGLEFVFET